MSTRVEEWPGVCCSGRALQLDSLIEERAAGAEEAIAAAVVELRATGHLVAAEVVRRWHAEGAQRHADSPGATDDGSGHPPV